MRKVYRIYRYTQRGIALPVAIVIILVLVTLAIALIIQSMSTKSLQKNVESHTTQAGVGEVVKGRMMEVFASGKTPDQSKLALIGLNAPPPPPISSPYPAPFRNFDFFSI